MKAIRLHSYGGPDVLVYEEVPRPTPAAGEVLVRVYATALNPVDRSTRTGYLQQMVNFELPLIPGLDLAGVVEELGPDVTTVAVGDAVYGFSNMVRQGAYAEYARLGVGELAPKPATVDFVTAAAVPLSALAAWQALYDSGGLRAGQTVLIQGAGGGVGTFAVQFAAAKGAHVIVTEDGSKAEFLRGLGAAEVIDYTTTRFEEVAHDVDVVLDLVGGEVQARSLAVLKPGGILVTTMGQPDADAASARGVRASGMLTQANPAQLREIAGMIDAGTIRPIVAQVFPLAEAAQAHMALDAGNTRGKLVLRVREQ
ncbi:MAG: NADP-dependent oxidoreductase [Chloroflexota bacterium]|nr:NADP-dependent oxidoreductase [Chloroflexota bacterium]